MKSIEDVARFLGRQPLTMSALRPVAQLGIDDCWIGAGFIRNAIWDHLHDQPAALVPESDVDVIYFDPDCASLERDLAIEARLTESCPGVPWSVHNQARMHERNGDAPYRDTEDAIAQWPETATAIAARLCGAEVEVSAPHGIDDLLQLIVRPTPRFECKLAIYRRRVAGKDWQRRWPRLWVIDA